MLQHYAEFITSVYTKLQFTLQSTLTMTKQIYIYMQKQTNLNLKPILKHI